MDFDPREKPTCMGQQSAEEFQVMIPARVGQSVNPQGVQAWIADQHLRQATGGRIAFEDGADITPKRMKHPPPLSGARAVLRLGGDAGVQLLQQLVGIQAVQDRALFDVVVLGRRASYTYHAIAAEDLDRLRKLLDNLFDGHVLGNPHLFYSRCRARIL